MNTYNDERVLYTFKAKRKLKSTSQAANMIASCLLSRGEENSVLEYDIYTIYLTENTFFAEYTRSMFHGGTPKKVTKLDIPIEDLITVDLQKEGEISYLFVESAWRKKYYFELTTDEDISIAEKISNYVRSKNNK